NRSYTASRQIRLSRNRTTRLFRPAFRPRKIPQSRRSATPTRNSADLPTPSVESRLALRKQRSDSRAPWATFLLPNSLILASRFAAFPELDFLGWPQGHDVFQSAGIKSAAYNRMSTIAVRSSSVAHPGKSNRKQAG